MIVLIVLNVIEYFLGGAALSYKAYTELIDRYKAGVLREINFRHDALHSGESWVVQKSGFEIQEAVIGYGNLINCLDQEGYSNQHFYEAVDLIGDVLLAVARTPDVTVPNSFVDTLEGLVRLLAPGMTESRLLRMKRIQSEIGI
jgi:hypothetical protein